MSRKFCLTRLEADPGIHFIFCTDGRNVLPEECNELSAKYRDKHDAVTQPGEALWVDLRPAFAVPLHALTPKTFLSVPLGYIPPDL